MPFGYSYLELWKIKEKAEFLKKHTNNKEKLIGGILLSITRGMLFLFLVYYVLFLFNGEVYKIYFYSAFLILCLNGIISQNYRRYLYVKYGYSKKEKLWKTILFSLPYPIGLLISLKFILGLYS